MKLLFRRKDISKAIQLQRKIALDYERLRKCSTSCLQYLFGSLNLIRSTNITGFATTDTRALPADTTAAYKAGGQVTFYFNFSLQMQVICSMVKYILGNIPSTGHCKSFCQVRPGRSFQTQVCSQVQTMQAAILATSLSWKITGHKPNSAMPY